MRKLRYLVGLSGLALALAFVLPPTAQGSVARAGTAVGGALSSVPTADSSCMGTTEKVAPPSGRIHMHFYYSFVPTNRACIGTVVERVHYTSDSCKVLHLDITYKSGAAKIPQRNHYMCGSRNQWRSYSWPVHKVYQLVIKVCVFAGHTTGHPCAKVA